MFCIIRLKWIDLLDREFLGLKDPFLVIGRGRLGLSRDSLRRVEGLRFIDKVGIDKLFVEIYKPFCEPEQLETLERIEKYSEENSDLYNTSIFDTNNITFSTTNPNYMIPDFTNIVNFYIIIKL